MIIFIYFFCTVYSSSCDLSLALGLVTLIASCWARSTISFLFRDETLWAISAEKVLFCINNTSNSCNMREAVQMSTYAESYYGSLDRKSCRVSKLLNWYNDRRGNWEFTTEAWQQGASSSRCMYTISNITATNSHPLLSCLLEYIIQYCSITTVHKCERASHYYPLSIHYLLITTFKPYHDRLT